MLEREHFIPFRKAAIFRMCLEDGRLDESRHGEFGEFARILDAFFHYEYHARLESLKDSYAPFDPDRDTRMMSDERSAEHRAAAHEQFACTLREILERANYRRVSREEIDEAMVRESLFKLQLHIDFDDFEEILLFRRGEEIRIEETAYFFGLRKRKIEVPTWLRVVLYVQFKDRAWFAAKHRKAAMFKPGSTILTCGTTSSTTTTPWRRHAYLPPARIENSPMRPCPDGTRGRNSGPGYPTMKSTCQSTTAAPKGIKYQANSARRP